MTFTGVFSCPEAASSGLPPPGAGVRV